MSKARSRRAVTLKKLEKGLISHLGNDMLTKWLQRWTMAQFLWIKEIYYTDSFYGKRWLGEVNKDLGTEERDGVCQQCKKVKNYFNDLSTHSGIQSVTGLRSLIGDHCLGYDAKERPKILAQLVISSFYIAKICCGHLTVDELKKWCTKFKIVAFVSQLPRSNNSRH